MRSFKLELQEYINDEWIEFIESAEGLEDFTTTGSFNDTSLLKLSNLTSVVEFLNSNEGPETLRMHLQKDTKLFLDSFNRLEKKWSITCKDSNCTMDKKQAPTITEPSHIKPDNPFG